MNRVMLTGNLAADPELKTTQSGISVCTFRLAVQRRIANRDGVREADFVPVVTWRGLADICAKYLAKGRKCLVTGTLQTRSYDAQDGSKRYVTEVIADEVEFLGGQKQGGEHEHGAAQSGEFTPVDIDDDELPF